MADDASRSLPPEPGVLGDETEEQNLNQPGDPKARITEEEVKAAFGTEPDETQKDKTRPDKTHQEKAHQDEALDHGVEESFPASDPPAVKHVD